MIAPVRAFTFTLGSVVCAFDPKARRRLQRWYFSGPQCPALEPADMAQGGAASAPRR